MAIFELRSQSVAAVTRQLNQMIETTKAKVVAALTAEAKEILTDSKEHYVPVDEGDLMRSGRVEKVKRDGKVTHVTIKYGGAGVPHAVAVHEHPSASSPPSWQGKRVRFHPAGRGPKYLERPIRKASSGMLNRLAKRLKG